MEISRYFCIPIRSSEALLKLLFCFLRSFPFMLLPRQSSTALQLEAGSKVQAVVALFVVVTVIVQCALRLYR